MSARLISRIIGNQRIFIILLLVLGVAWFLYLRDQPRSGKLHVLEQHRMVVNPDCDVTKQSCSAVLDGTVLRLRLGPGVSALKPFPLALRLEGLEPAEIQGVLLEYSMKGMDMGPNRVVLRRGEAGEWRGSSILPICTSGRSDWRVEVQVVGKKRMFTAQFPFVLKGPAAQ